MTKDEPDPLWLPPISLLVIALITWQVSLTSYAIIPFRVTGQAFLFIVALRAFCYWPPMVRWVTSMPIPHRVIFALMIGGMVLGHYTLNSRTYFPFVSWFIFPSVREDDPVTCPEFIGTTASHQKVRLIVEQLFPSIVQIFPLDDQKQYSPEQLEHLVHAMANVYNEYHADDPVRRIDMVVMAVHLHPPANESRAQPSCQLLKRYEISSGQ